MTHATQRCNQYIEQNKKNIRDVVQISIALTGNVGAVFCFSFFKDMTPAFLMANTFTLLILLNNTFFKY